MQQFLSLLITTFLSAACFAQAAEPVPLREGPVSGFVTHYHEGDLETLGESSVTAELSDLIHWRMLDLPEEPTVDDLQWDFSHAEGWLPMLYATGRRGFPIIDTAVHHSSIPWRQAMTRRAGQNHLGPDGKEWAFSSLHSPLFRESVFRYIEAFTRWFKEHDTEGYVQGYMGGAEWFYPGSMDYSPMAMAAFQEWMRAKYATLDAVNTAWGSTFEKWGAIDPPRPFVVGGHQTNEPTFALDGGVDASYASEAVAVTPGQQYEVSALAKGKDAAARLAGVHVAWFTDTDSIITVSAITTEEIAPHSFQCKRSVTPPPNAATMRFHCKLLSTGAVTFTKMHMREVSTGRLLISAETDTWTHQQYTGKSTAHRRQSDEGSLLTLSAQPGAIPFAHSAQALEDWTTFSFEALAHWLNDCATYIKECDPDRLVASYVGFVFAQQAQWDYAMVNQRLDISLANSPAIDVNGIQMCIAGRDYTWATHIVDTARKYDKPIWSTDLIDFPYGLYSGFEAIYRGTLACVQHGMDGAFWYGWKGVPDYSFLQRMTKVDRERLVNDTQTALKTVEGYEIVSNIALLMPMMSYSLADAGGYKGDMLDSGGLYHLMLDSGITPDVWTPYEVSKQTDNALKDYDAVFLSDCPVLAEPVYMKLLAYVQEGGVLLHSGRLPQKDLSEKPFAQKLDGLATVAALGDRLGRSYWGKLRREQVYGNTPPVLVEAPDPTRTPAMRKRARQKVNEALESMQVRRAVAFVENPGEVHVTPFRHPDTGIWRLFIVHKGEGRCHHVDLRLDLGENLSKIEAWCDFDQRHSMEFVGENLVRTPDFAHACIVTLTP